MLKVNNRAQGMTFSIMPCLWVPKGIWLACLWLLVPFQRQFNVGMCFLVFPDHCDAHLIKEILLDQSYQLINWSDLHKPIQPIFGSKITCFWSKIIVSMLTEWGYREISTIYFGRAHFQTNLYYPSEKVLCQLGTLLKSLESL